MYALPSEVVIDRMPSPSSVANEPEPFVVTFATLVPLNLTFTLALAANPVPLTMYSVPIMPVVGSTVIAGGTIVKFAAAETLSESVALMLT